MTKSNRQQERKTVALRVLNDADPEITAIVDDSRQATPGALFVAIKGDRVDGHRFIADAVAHGASAVICEELPLPLPDCPVIQVDDSRRALSMVAGRHFGSPSQKLRVSGVTGTDGKTSTAEILAAILEEAGRPAGTIGTLGVRIADRRFDTELTTPGPIILYDIFSRMLQEGATDVVMEVSSHSLIQSRVADVAFDAAILTNITQDHLDTHRTRENYARAKRILFEQLEPDSVAILPAESEFCRPFRDATDAEVLTYGMQNLADVTGRILSFGAEGMDIDIQAPFEQYRVRTHLIGDYNCLNILAAVTAAFAYGIGGEVVRAALAGFRGVPGRLEKVTVPGRNDLPAVCVDYAHTPAALEKVLRAVRPLVRGKVICVAGCGGDRDRDKRPKMGKIAAEHADIAVFTADNSRSERTEDIIGQMLAGVGSSGAACKLEPDRRRAIQLAISLASSADSMVVICGRGCEKYQKLGGRKIPFDDRRVTREIMERMPMTRRKSA